MVDGHRLLPVVGSLDEAPSDASRRTVPAVPAAREGGKDSDYAKARPRGIAGDARRSGGLVGWWAGTLGQGIGNLFSRAAAVFGGAIGAGCDDPDSCIVLVDLREKARGILRENSRNWKQRNTGDFQIELGAAQGGGGGRNTERDVA